MKAYIKSDILNINTEPTLIELLKKRASDNVISENGIIFVNNKGKETKETYKSLFENSLKILSALQEKGYKKSDYLIFQITDELHFIRLFWACILGGIIPIPLTVSMTLSKETEAFKKLLKIKESLNNPEIVVDESVISSYIEEYENNNVKYILSDDLMQGDQNEAKIINTSEEDIAYIQYSSGSTGDPKGVVLSHKNLIYNVMQICEKIEGSPEDFSGSWLPLTHDMGLVGFHLAPLYYGVNQLRMSPGDFIRKPLLFLEKISSHGVTVFSSPNFGLKWMIKRIKDKKMKDLDLSSVRLIFNGAEPISLDVVRSFYKKFMPAGLRDNTIYYVYGMAEACVGVTFPEIYEESKSVIINRKQNKIGNRVEYVKKDDIKAAEFAVLGKPLAGMEVKVVDDEGKTLEQNQIGNIVIKGPNVFKGYFNNVEAKFTDDGFFQTGDLGFITENNLVITGRKKDILFINGQNYFAHDLENIIESLPSVGNEQSVVVGQFNDKKGKDDVIVFIRQKKSLDEFMSVYDDVREFLYKSLGFLVDYIIPIQQIPKTTSGKVQRYKLRDDFNENKYEKIINSINKYLDLQKEKTAEELDDNEIKTKVLDIIENIFNINSLTLKDNLFDLGLNSIKIMSLINELENEFDIKISAVDIIDIKNIKDLVLLIKNSSGTSDSQKYPEVVVDKNKWNEPFDLTEVQSAYLMGRTDSFEMGGISTHAYYEFKTRLDIKRFNDAFNKAILRHPMLRTVVYSNGKQQILKEVPEYKIVVEDLRNLNNEKVESIIKEERDRMSHYVFDSEKWPLFEMKAFRLTDEENYILWGFDLLIMDGSSMLLLIEEILDYYKNPDIVKENLDFSFYDYIQGYNMLKNTELYKGDQKYWRKKLIEFPEAPQLPLKKEPADIEKPHFERVQRKYSYKKWEKIKEVAEKQGITPSVLLCTLYAQVLGRRSNQKELAINLTVYNRYPFHPDIMKVIGDFTSVILVDFDLSLGEDFWELSKNVQINFMKALEHRHYSGVNMMRDIMNRDNINGKAIMPIVYTSMLFDDLNKSQFSFENADIQIENAISQTPQVYLDFQVMNDSSGLYLSWDYVSDIFEKQMIEDMFSEFTNMLEGIINNNDFDIKMSSEDKKLISEYNDTETDIQPELLHNLIKKQVEKTPDNIAIKLGDETMTYKELWDRSNKTAAYLLKSGCQKGEFIGVLVARKIETIVNLVAVLKSGCAYIPIDPEYPEDRKSYIIEHSRCKTILNPDIYEKENIESFDSSNIENRNELDDVAYAIYTSGSTGRPKGVVITHRAVSNTIIDINNKFNVTENDKILGLSSMCFDLSVYDIFGALSSGAVLVLVPDLLDVKNIARLVEEDEITIWNSVPSIMEMHIDYLYDNSIDVKYWQSQNDNLNIGIGFNDTLRVVMLSGDWINIELPDRIKEKYPFADIISLGGATEASIWSIYFPIDVIDEKWNSIPYGYPLANQTFHVLDFNGDECPVGTPGELYIGGAGVAKCYLNDENKTGKAFIQHKKFGRIYKTGDFGVLKKDGYIEFLGRRDHQVKIRGFRIELGEIESCLAKLEQIKSAVVTDYTDDNNIKNLCAYIVPETDLNIDDIKEELKTKLPDYMIPSLFVKLGKMPLSSNGKIDRKRLPEPNSTIQSRKRIIHPSNDIEKKLVEMWRSLLKIDDIGIDDNFFELGGDSLKGAQFITRMSKELNVDISLRKIFTEPTIREIAKHINNQKTDDISSVINKVDEKEYYELSSAQKRIFILNQFDNDSINYNTTGIFQIEGELNKEYLEEVIKKLIDRHEGFRTSFVMKEGDVYQKITTKTDVSIEYIDIQKSKNKENIIESIIDDFIKPFDLRKAPIFRTGLVQVSEERYILLFDTHHIISDAISQEIIIKDFIDLYNNKELEPLNIQYKDYAEWQNNALKNGNMKKEEDFWCNKFKDSVPVLDLPTDYSRPKKQTFEGTSYFFEFNKELKDRLEELKIKTNSTLYMILLSAFNIVLSKYSGQNNIIIGSPIAGRPHDDLNNIVGMFVNTLPMRSRIKPTESFQEFLNKVRENSLKAFENQEYPFESLVEKLNIQRDISRNPLFDVFFAMQNMERTQVKVNDLEINPYPVKKKISKFDISLYAYEEDDKLNFEFEYCTKLYRETTIKGFAKAFERVIEQIVEKPDIIIKNIEVIDENSKKKILKDFNNTTVPYDKEKTIHEIFEKQVKIKGNSTALYCRDKKISYNELNEKSNQLARLLREKGILPNDIVALLVDRSIEMMIGLMAVLKAGGAYIPIDPGYPEERINFMLEDSSTKIILTMADYKEKLDRNLDNKIETVDINDEKNYIGSKANLENVNSSNDLAYVIYTSGSTGTPKGVMIEHQSVNNFMLGINQKTNMTEHSRVLAVTTISFDIFVLESILPLCYGMEVVVAGEEEQKDPDLLGKLVRDRNIEIIQMTPTMLKMELSQWSKEDYKSVKKLLVGGEELPPALLTELNQKGSWQIYNMYGPTETTVWSAISDLTGREKVNIGKPIANTDIYILDKCGNLCPIGVTGELFIGGDGLARGYINRQNLTEERFIQNPYDNKQLIYRTGDLARWLPDGNIECLGRIDNQVKVSGHRIELGEIENQLLEIDDIEEAAVVVKENKEKYLCGYFISEKEITVKEIRNNLQKKLPQYMIPTYFMKMDSFPLTANGKIDRKSFPEPEVNVLTGSEFERPGNELEERITKVWQKVLGRKHISINDNFFEVGGSSLKIVQLSQMLTEELDQKVEAITLFQYPNIKSFAEYINRGSQQLININKRKNRKTDKKVDIAVIGISGRFPGAKNPEEFWQNLKNGKESIHFYTDEELLELGVSEEMINNPHYIKAASTIDNIEYFDAEFFGYTPGDAQLLDPQIRIFEECAWQAFEDSGYVADEYDGKVGVFAGASQNIDWQNLTFGNNNHPSEMFNIMQLNDRQFLPTHVSYKLNITGPSVFVNTACSSFLAALHMACVSIKNNECDMAMAGCINATQILNAGYLYQDGMIMSEDGHCRAFDDNASGTIFGNGVGIVIVKPLDKAIQDNDNIYAVVKGSAINNDGQDKVGFSAPSINGQSEVIQEALINSEVEPESVTYIEAHGTGTPLGDPVEITALKRGYNSSGKHSCAIGSVKTNIGHLDVAAGAAGFLKAVLALKHKMIPASLNYDKPNRNIDFENSPFFVNTELRKWESNNNYPLRAGVSSLGIGGTNTHVILEEAPEKKRTIKKRDYNIINISAKSAKSLLNYQNKLADFLKNNNELDLEDVAYTLAIGRKEFNYRKSIVCKDINDAIKKLSGNNITGIKNTTKNIVFMFSGQGSQYSGMGEELYNKVSKFREIIDDCFDKCRQVLGYDVKEIVFGSTEKINETEIAQVALYVFEYSLSQLLLYWGISPDLMIGHSIGEYVAATLAGVITIDEGIKLISIRGKLMQEMPRGVMISVRLSEEEAKKYINEKVSIALVNSSNLCVLSGEEKEISYIENELNNDGITNIRLKTSHAFHSEMMIEAAEKYREYLNKVNLKEPQKKFISNLTGKLITKEEATDPEYWVKHMVNTVRFEKGIKNILKNRDNIIIEVGPGNILTSLVKAHDDYNEEHSFINLVKHVYEPKGDYQYLAEKVSLLWESGLKIDWEAYYRNTGSKRISLPTYSFDRKRYWIDNTNIQLASSILSQNNALTTSKENQLVLEEVSTTAVKENLFQRPELSTEYKKAENETEEKLKDIAEGVFKIEGIGTNDNFFELGADSLKCVTFITKVNKEMDIDIPVNIAFQMLTIKELSDYIRSQERKKHYQIEKCEEKEYYEVSSAQKRIYLLNKMAEKSTRYNLPEVIEIKGELDQGRVKDTFKKLAYRHESLRTSFELIDGEITQIIHDEIEPDILYFDIRESDNNKDTEINRIIQEEIIEPFNLSKLPLLKVALIHIEDEKYVMVLDIHHIITDGKSMGIIIKDFINIYNGNKLPELNIQYKDFAVWQNQIFKTEEFKNQKNYWLNQFQGEIPVLSLPTDYPRFSVPNFEGSQLDFELDKEIKEKLVKFNQENGTTLYITLLAAFNILLSKYSVQDDIIIGSPIEGRPHTELENIVGMFVNTLPMRNKPTGDKTFLDFVEEVKSNSLAAYEHQDYPFEMLVDNIKANQDKTRNPLFDVTFVMQNRNALEEFQLANHIINQYEYKRNVSLFDLTLTAVENNDYIKMSFEYSTKLFKKKTIDKFKHHFINIINQLIANPDVKIKDVELMSEKEIEQVLLEFNNTEVKYSKAKVISELFEEQVEANPNSTALFCNGSTMSYKELNEKSNQLARLLRNKGVLPNKVVGIIMDRSFEMIISIMGVLKAGGAYLPIDPNYPEERISFVLDDSAAEVVITKNQYKNKAGKNVDIIDLSDETVYTGNKENLEKVNKSNDLAYVIYTSGSTGTPKGVMIEHKSVHNLLIGINKKVKLNTYNRILAITTISFDIFVLETILPLCSGMEVIIATEEEQKNPSLLGRLIQYKKVEIIQMTPSMLKMELNGWEAEDYKTVKTLLVGGEQLTPSLLKEIKNKHSWNIFNMYGPTETTVWSTISDLTNKEKVTIGRPIANTQIYILDNGNKLCTTGVIGELCIGGDGLARGYFNREDLTSQKFVENPYDKNDTIYKTGDLARWLPDGNIECLGRTDYQVKIRGHRIELGEIENTLMLLDDIKEAVVLVKENRSHEKYLCGYIIPNKNITIRDLRNKLKESLPHYMIPTHFVKMEKFPLTPNGKIDRKSFPDVHGNVSTGVEYEEPRNKTEKKLITIFKDVLEHDQIGINDNFFDLGGDSLKAIRLLSSLEKYDIKIQYNTLISYPTVKYLAKYLEKTNVIVENKVNKIEELEQIFKDKINKNIKIIKHQVNKQEYIIYFVDEENRLDKDLILTVANNFSVKELWPHYIVPRDLSEMNKNLSEKEFYEITNIGKEKQEKSISDIVLPLNEQNRNFVDSIINQKVINKFPCSAIQKSTLNFNGRMTGLILPIDTLVGENIVFEAVKSIIKEQQLLRSVLDKSDDQIMWKEYQMPDNLSIPFLDLSQFDVQKKNQIIEHIVKEKYQEDYKYNELSFRFIFIKENLRNYKLIAPMDHLIFDGMTAEILERSIEEFITKYKESNYQGKMGENTYSSYVKQMLNGPVGIDSKDLIEKFNILEYKDYSQKIEYYIQKNGNDKTNNMQIKIELSKINNNKIWETSFLISVLLCQELFDVDKVPIKMLYYGRNYQDHDYNNIVGYFSDFIPLLISLDDNNIDQKIDYVRDAINFVKDHNVNFTSLYYSKELQEEWSSVSQYGNNSSLNNYDQMIVYNFQGKRNLDDQLIGLDDLAVEQHNIYRLEGSSFNIASYYTNEFLYLDIVSRCPLDNDKLSRRIHDRIQKLF